jgi:RNA polymerase sigma-70 factor (ECF subfamily)
LRPDTHLAAWLFTVARNLYWSYCRSRMLEDQYGGLIDVWPAPHTPASPFDETALRELEARVESAMARLPPRDREVLLLVAVEGLTPSEAAVVCGVTPEALRQRLSRARVQLHRLLAATPPPARLVPREELP